MVKAKLSNSAQVVKLEHCTSYNILLECVRHYPEYLLLIFYYRRLVTPISPLLFSLFYSEQKVWSRVSITAYRMAVWIVRTKR